MYTSTPGANPPETFWRLTRAGPLEDGVQLNQTELSAKAPPWKSSSPGSPVERIVVVGVLPDSPVNTEGLAKLSLDGGLVDHCSPKLPVEPPKPSTATRYVVPAVTGTVIFD